MMMNAYGWLVLAACLSTAGCSSDAIDGDTSSSTGGSTGSGASSGTVACQSAVPSGASVVKSGQELQLVDASRAVLVCPGGTLIAHGGNTNVWVQSGGEANINGGGSNVVAKGSAKITVNADQVHVYQDGGSSVTDNGQGTSVTTCDSVDIDAALADGC